LRGGCGFSARGPPSRIVQTVHRLTVRARYQVPIGVHGDLYGVVPHLIPHVGEGLPVPDEPRREGVPEVVEPNPPKPRLLQTQGEGPPHVRRVEGRPVNGGENPLGERARGGAGGSRYIGGSWAGRERDQAGRPGPLRSVPDVLTLFRPIRDGRRFDGGSPHGPQTPCKHAILRG
jgi:hypothetical protein